MATKQNHDFERGYFCAVATLLREGYVQQAHLIFHQSSNPEYADACDIEVFRLHGLLPASELGK